MATDQATADYEAEQERLAALRDDYALERSLADAIPAPPPSPVCAQCINWQAQRWLDLADGTVSSAQATAPFVRRLTYHRCLRTMQSSARSTKSSFLSKMMSLLPKWVRGFCFAKNS